jgi:hypothetical protein
MSGRGGKRVHSVDSIKDDFSCMEHFSSFQKLSDKLWGDSIHSLNCCSCHSFMISLSTLHGCVAFYYAAADA